MKRWLPLSDAVLRMVVEMGPSPLEAQPIRAKTLWPKHPELEEAALEEIARVRHAISSCDPSPAAPVIIFVSKMVPMKL
ncbi:unnamed protein product, partial [Discosporangium mesarthrocarpum]